MKRSPKIQVIDFLPMALLLYLIWAEPSYATLESSLIGIKMKLTTVVLPLLSVIGLVCSAISLYTGNPNAKQHILYAIFGCIIGFGAQAIVDVIAQTVR